MKRLALALLLLGSHSPPVSADQSARELYRLRSHNDSWIFQAGWQNIANGFYGLAQTALYTNHARTFIGGLQYALWYNQAREMLGLGQLAAINSSDRFAGLFQIGGWNEQRRWFIGALQLGALNQSWREFYGVAQIGVCNESHRTFVALAQIGAFNWMFGRGPSGFLGLTQAGLVNVVEGSAIALVAQVGLYNSVDGGPLWTPLQLGVVNRSGRFRGLVQLGALNYEDSHLYGAQIGVANFARTVSGLQIGLVNFARRLEGVQIGLINFARFGALLPVMPILNVGF